MFVITQTPLFIIVPIRAHVTRRTEIEEVEEEEQQQVKKHTTETKQREEESLWV